MIWQLMIVGRALKSSQGHARLSSYAEHHVPYQYKVQVLLICTKHMTYRKKLRTWLLSCALSTPFPRLVPDVSYMNSCWPIFQNKRLQIYSENAMQCKYFINLFNTRWLWRFNYITSSETQNIWQQHFQSRPQGWN